jgi:hypothetical protein
VDQYEASEPLITTEGSITGTAVNVAVAHSVFSNVVSSALGGVFGFGGNSKVKVTFNDVEFESISSSGLRACGSALFLNTTEETVINHTRFTSCEVLGQDVVEGGAIYISSTANITLYACNFKSCKSLARGGGAYLDLLHSGMTIDITDTSFFECVAEEYGGGLYVSGDSIVNLNGLSFKGCEAGSSGGGGAAVLSHGNVIVQFCLFYECGVTTASVEGGGGGLYVQYADNLLIHANTFEFCNVTGQDDARGGGLYIAASSLSNPDLHFSNFSECSTNGMGGGAFINNSANVEGCVF